MKEIWKDIPWWKWYKISNLWNIESFKKYKEGRLLKTHINSNWYVRISLTENYKQKTLSIHRLVMLAFHWPSKLEVNHKDWNPLNNRLENLEYCTRSENIQHRYKVLWRFTRKWKCNIKNNPNKFIWNVFI